MTRATVRGLSAAALALAVLALVAAPAHAAAYRYWTYWQAPVGAPAWAFATQGPGTALPADGAVEGWAFGVTTQSGSLDDAPQIAPDFDAVCGSTPAVPDRKRVALVVDTGPPAVAPDGQAPPVPIMVCVVAEPDASGYDILRSVADVRTEAGLVCGIAGYPTGECAPVLDDATAAALMARAAVAPAPTAPAALTGMPDTQDTDPDVAGGSPWATVAVATLLLGGVAFVVVRRRRPS